jgi:glycosyltransferase involved in cell wall biosynthesis
MVSSDFLPNIGGVAIHIFELSKALISLGNKIYVLNVSYGLNNDAVEDMDGISVHRLYVKNTIRKIRILPKIYRAIRYLNSLIKEERIDIIHWHDLIPGAWTTKMVSFSYKTPVVFTNHTSVFLQLFEKRLSRYFLKLSIDHANAIIAPSRELYEKTKILSGRIRLWYIPNGVNVDKFSPLKKDNEKIKKIKEKYKIENDESVIFCPRRIVPKNGIRFLVKAIPLIKQKIGKFRVMITGSSNPEEESEILRIIKNDHTTNYVIFTGAVPNSEMPDYYMLSDVVVLPSLIEATSISGLEAMALEKALVGTNVGGIPEIISDGENGIIVPPRDPSGLAKAIVTLLLDKELRIRYGRKGREIVLNRFTWERIAKETLKVYNDVTRIRNGVIE